MNKKVSTLLVATLLAAGPAFTAAYAQSAVLATATTEVTDGFKFYYGAESNQLLKVEQKEIKGGQKVWTLVNTTGEALDEAKSAKFEIRNLKKSGSNVIFELWANGNKIYVTANGDGEVDKNTNLNDLVSQFYIAGANSDSKFLVNEIAEIKAFVPGEEPTFGAANSEAYTAEKDYDQTAFEEYNGYVALKAFSFSFNSATEKLEGNVFTDMIAIDGDNGVIFVKGDKKQIEKFVETKDFAEEGKSLQFIAIQKDATYSINGLQTNEGKKLVWVSGETIAKKPTNYVTEFTVNEADRLNAESELTLTAELSTGVTVKVGAVRPSATDNTTYVTTMLNEGSKFTYIPATLGNNEYLDASILLKKNAQNVVSIYFTSGKPGASEYHKYLTKTTDAVASANEVDPTLPVNQWVVSDFDGKYNFTFTNRADESETVTLRLTKGGAEGGYKVVKVAGSDFITTEDENGLSVKFLPIATTRTDGYLTLTDAQIKEGIKLAFTGKTNVAGELTFYATEVKNTSTSHKELLPSLDGDAKMLVPVANVNDKKQFTIQHEYSYACLNDKGEVVEGKKDTLFIPTYNFITVVDKDNADNNYYLDATRGTEAVKTNAGLFTFAKNIAGTYSLATVSGTDFNAVKVAQYWTVEAGTGEVDMVFKSYTNFTTPDYVNQYFANVKILSGAELNMSLPAQQGHFTFDNERGSISMTDIKGINEGALASEGMVFWLDSVDTDAEMPAFYISRGIEGNETARMYMYNTIDSAKVFDEASANYKYNDVYFYGEDAQKGKNPELKVGFAAATEEAGKDLADQFKFNITLKDAAVADEYILSSVKKISLPNASIDDKQVYVAQKNGVVILTAEKENAMAFTLNKAEAPTSNESVVASEVKVVAQNGSVVVKNAAGKNVVVSTILGQVVANEVLTSDNATINVPAGIVVVAVEGESFKVNVK